MGRKVNMECTCCPKKTRKRKHGGYCPDCGGKLKSVSANPGNPGRGENLKMREKNATEDG